MGNKVAIILCVVFFLQSCNFGTSKYLPGFDFRLFDNTPIEELSSAVENEDVSRIHQLAKAKSINVDYQEPKFGHTLLMLAVANNKTKSVEALLENGANPNLTSKLNEDNAISIAAENYSDVCDTGILYMLHKFGGNFNFMQTINRIEDNGMHSYVKRTVLMIAAGNDCFPIAKYIADNGADINKSTYYDGYSAITEAIIQDNLKLVKYLIVNKGAKVPKYVFRRRANVSYEGEPEQNLTIIDLLNEKHYATGSENYKLRDEILNYIKK